MNIKNIITKSDKKQCSKCSELKDATEDNFYTQKHTKDGNTYYTLSADCKECRKKKNLEYYYIPENYERRNKQHALYRKENENKRRIYRRKRRKEREDVREYEKEWRRQNKDKVKEYGQIYSNKKHNITNTEWISCKDYFGYKCAYCGISESDAKKTQGQNFHREHIIPEGRNDLKNCIPSCRSCNTSKHQDSFNNWYNPNNPVYSRERYLKIYQWLKFDVKKFIVKKRNKLR